MNPEMEKRIQEARDAGYSEEEIQQELAILQGTAPEPQVAPQVPIDRTEEYTGLAQGIGLEAAKTAAELGGLYYGGKKLLGAAGKAFGPGSGPVSPAQQTFNTLAASDAQNAARAAQQQNMLQRGMQYADKVRQIALDKVMQTAQKAAPMARAAAPYAGPAAVGLGSLFYSGGLNQGEDEELRRRQAMPPTIR